MLRRIWDEGGAPWSTLAAFTAHEVRNPLAALRAMAQLTMLTSDPDVRQRMMRQIVEGIDELDLFLRQVLYLSRPDGVPLDRVDIGALLRDVAQLFAAKAAEAGVAIRLRSPTPAPVARANAELLRHVFINLVKNSMEAMPAGGPIDITAAACVRRGSVRVRVRDRGTGIAKRLRPRLLTDGTASSRSAGGGLGLTFVRRVVHDIHAGKVWFRTKTGVGTIFCVEIPAADGPAACTRADKVAGRTGDDGENDAIEWAV